MAWTLAFAYSLAPLDFAPSPVAAPVLGEPLSIEGSLGLLLHVLAFAALGAADRFGSRRGDLGSRALPTVLARGILLCVAIEFGQIFVPVRHAALADLVANSVGLLLGHLSTRPIVRRSLDNWPAAVRKLQSPRLQLSFLALWGLFWSSLVFLPTRLVALEDWDPDYFLLIGNEKGGTRPWEGEIHYVALYDRALSPDEVRTSLAQPPAVAGSIAARSSMGLLVAYDFSRVGRLEIEPEGALVASGLQIVLPADSRWNAASPRALVLDKGATLTSAAAAAQLSTAIVSHNAFSVEVWCRPANLFQQGPARIVGISDGTLRRNFTLGQEGSALHFRVRNRINGPNGSDFELRAPAALSEDLLQIVATYTEGISSIFRNAQPLTPTIDLREPSVILGLGTGPVGRVVTALLAALSLILLGSRLLQRPGEALTLVRLLLLGYSFLLFPLVVGILSSHRPAGSLPIWFGPALVLSWVWLCRVSRIR